jgi:hypothetical protein
MPPTERKAWILPLSLEHIEATVASHLGQGRVAGNEPGPCFSRQISMYLANRVAGWSTPRIGKFYNGCHHTTVLHAIGKVERMRQSDESIDALVKMLTAALNLASQERSTRIVEPKWREAIIETVATRVLHRLQELDAAPGQY